MGIPENLKRLREAAGLSQNELADKAGLSQQLVSQLERGVNRTTRTLPQLAHALGVTIYEIDPDFGAGGKPDAAREELMSVYDRLGVLPGWQEYLLQQARQLEAHVRGQADPQPPKAAGGKR
jgi:transcriptional regulator with XRE-family HTH domain